MYFDQVWDKNLKFRPWKTEDVADYESTKSKLWEPKTVISEWTEKEILEWA
jgi:hypothetical protein